MAISIDLLLFLILVAFVAGFISSIAGSGGLIVLPILLASGVPVINALATNKFQSVFGTLSSTINFYQKGLIDFQRLKLSIFFAFIGSLLGTLFVQYIDRSLLELIIPYLLIVLAVYTLFSPSLGEKSRAPLIKNKTFALGVGGGLGFYGGFFGPAMGSFSALAFSALGGENAKVATAHTKPIVLVTNSASLLIFIFGGHVVWGLAVFMAIAQALGARLGSNLVITKGAALVKPVVVIVCLGVALKLFLFS